jgi:hypothetical protein
MLWWLMLSLYAPVTRVVGKLSLIPDVSLVCNMDMFQFALPL